MYNNYNTLENYNISKIQNSYNSPTGAPVNDSPISDPECGVADTCIADTIDGRTIAPCPPACDWCVRNPNPYTGAANKNMGTYTAPDGKIIPQYLVTNEYRGICLPPPEDLPWFAEAVVASNREPQWGAAFHAYAPPGKSPPIAGLTIPGSANSICSNFKDEFIYWQNQYQTIMSQGWQPELNASVGLPSIGGVNKTCVLHQEGNEQTASCDSLDKQIFLQTARLNMAFARDNFQQCTRMVRDKSPVCSKPDVAPFLCTTNRDSSLNLVQQSGTGGTQTALKTDDIKKIADGGNRPISAANKEDGWWGVPPLSGPHTTASPNPSRASINNYDGGILLPSAVRRCHK